MTKTRTGWAHTFTLAGLVVACAAGAMLSVRPGVVELRKNAGDGKASPGLAGMLERVDEKHRLMVERRIEAALSKQVMAKMSACFTPGTPSEVMEAFRAAEARLNHFDDRFQIAPRWESTAYTPGGSALGKPVTISWSIVPDGTFVEGFNGEADAPSNLRAYLNGIYGSEAAWLPIFQSVFDRWTQVSGLTYVYEPSDDGAALQSPVSGGSTFFGVPGVRGDVRISGHTIDGNSGVLAYNFYPDINDALGGDMVIDTGDNFFFTTSGNSVRLRDVVSHEHGHGIGQAHVCPIETTKLMEPFVSTIFDGPRHDDIRHVQYSYGDVNEPNDFSAQATDLGSLDCASVSVGDMPAPVGPVAGAITETPIASTVSLSHLNDDDFYRFTVSSASRIGVKVTPLGLAYDDAAQACSGQNGSCCSGSPTNSLSTIDLAVNILGADGTTLIASADATGAGASEQLVDVALPAAGTYYIQIKPAGGGAGSESNAQFYHLDASARPATVLASIAGNESVAVPAGELVPVSLDVADGTEAFDLSASRFYYSLNGGATFVEAPLYDHGGGQIVAALADVSCGASLQFYAEVRSTIGSVVRLPCSGVYAPRVGSATDVYSTNFDAGSAGWTVGPNTATSGVWVNVSPIGSAAQPGADHTGPGGQCFVTGQGAIGESAGAADIDGGQTLLTSPTMNMAGMQDATISYWRWYSTGAGGAPYADTFLVQVSVNGGGTWNTAEIVGPGSVADPNVNPGWRFKSFSLSGLGLAPTASVRVRFNASDTGTGSLVEAALDDFGAVGYSCAPVAWCSGDMNLDGLVEDQDFVIFSGAYNILDCGEEAMPAGCPSDLNGDGFVDDADFVLFAAAYNELLCP